MRRGPTRRARTFDSTHTILPSSHHTTSVGLEPSSTLPLSSPAAAVAAVTRPNLVILGTAPALATSLTPATTSAGAVSAAPLAVPALVPVSVIPPDSAVGRRRFQVKKLQPSHCQLLRLAIGTWHFTGERKGDLMAKLYYVKKQMIWEAKDTRDLKWKMEFSFSDIVFLQVQAPAAEPTVMIVDLNRAPRFFHQVNPVPHTNTLWSATGDFTGGQASRCLRHILWFPEGSLTNRWGGYPSHYDKLVVSDERIRGMLQATPRFSPPTQPDASPGPEERGHPIPDHPSVWANAPEEVLAPIFEQLDPESLACASQVCHHWRRVSEPAWHRQCQKCWRSVMWDKLTFSPDAWHHSYNVGRLRDENWKMTTYEVQKFSGHRCSVPVVRKRGSIMCSGGRNGEIKIWHTTTDVVHSLHGHEGVVSCLDHDGTKIVSGSGVVWEDGHYTKSQDSMVRLWDIATRKECFASDMHVPTSSLLLEGDTVVVGGCRGGIDVLDLRTPQSVLFEPFSAHSDVISALSLDFPVLAAASWDYRMTVWDLRKQSALSPPLQGGDEAYGFGACLQFDGDALRIATTGGLLERWRIKGAPECVDSLYWLHNPDGHEIGRWAECVDFDNQRLVWGMRSQPGLPSSNEKGHTPDTMPIVGVYDLQSEECLHQLQGHEASVLSVHLGDWDIVTSDAQGEIRHWNFAAEPSRKGKRKVSQ